MPFDVPRGEAARRERAGASSRKRAALWLGLAITSAWISLGACARPYGSETETELQATELPDVVAAAEEDGDLRSEPDSESDDDAADAAEDSRADAVVDSGVDAGPCANKANGFRWGTTNDERCCGQKAVTLRTTTNCGGCGITCAGGRTCSQVSGHWLCRGCASNDECADSVGAGATCYEGYCDCQGTCPPGQQCFQPSGHNYCAYP